MEDKNRKFRLRLNLFDCVVILLAVAVAGVLLWMRLKPAQTAAEVPAASRIEYTIRLQKVLEGTGALVNEGDELVDAIKNFALGKVTAVRVEPAVDSIINEEQLCYVTAEIPGYEDLYLTVESSGTVNAEQVLVGGGYAVRAGEDIYVRGPGYLGSGEVYTVERGA